MWFWYAISASILWGIGYVINQLLMRSFSAIEILLFESFIILLIFIPYFIITGQFKPTLVKLLDWRIIGLILAGSLIYISAAIFILKSIGSSNATLAAIIEASYPIFTMFFAYLLIGEVQFTLSTIIGCLLIISGLVVVHSGH